MDESQETKIEPEAEETQLNVKIPTPLLDSIKEIVTKEKITIRMWVEKALRAQMPPAQPRKAIIKCIQWVCADRWLNGEWNEPYVWEEVDGEPIVAPNFLYEILSRLQENGISLNHLPEFEQRREIREIIREVVPVYKADSTEGRHSYPLPHVDKAQYKTWAREIMTKVEAWYAKHESAKQL